MTNNEIGIVDVSGLRCEADISPGIKQLAPFQFRRR